MSPQDNTSGDTFLVRSLSREQSYLKGTYLTICADGKLFPGPLHLQHDMLGRYAVTSFRVHAIFFRAAKLVLGGEAG